MMEKGSRFLSSLFSVKANWPNIYWNIEYSLQSLKKNSVFPFPFQEHLILSSVFSEVNNFDVLAKKYTAR